MPRACVLSLLTVLAALTAGPAEARCRRAILEAARTDSRPSHLERELGAEAESESASTSRTSRVRVAALAPAPDIQVAGRDGPPAKFPLTALPSNPEPSALAPAAPPEAAWPIEPGKSLRQTLETWTAQAGWHLVWSSSLAQVDYRIEAAHVWRGDFLAAVKALMGNYRTVEIPLKVEPILGNRQLRVLAESDGFSGTAGDE